MTRRTGVGGRRDQVVDLQMILAVLSYAYAKGTVSSRRIAWKLEEYVVYVVLAAGKSWKDCGVPRPHW